MATERSKPVRPTSGASRGRRRLAITPALETTDIRNDQPTPDEPPQTLSVNDCRLSVLHIDLSELSLALVKWGFAADTEAAEAMVRSVEASVPQLEVDFGRALRKAAGISGHRGRPQKATPLDEIASRYAHHWEPRAERFLEACKLMQSL